MATPASRIMTTDPEGFSSNIRAEYAAISAYAISTVNSRFTTAGLYMAANGFLAGAVLKSENLPFTLYAVACIFGCLISICIWMVELRTRQVLFFLGLRCRCIEIELWGLPRFGPEAGFHTNQSQAVPDLLIRNPGFAEEIHSGQSVKVFGFPLEKLPSWLWKRISHSMAFDLLYAGGIMLWIVLLCQELIVRIHIR